MTNSMQNAYTRPHPIINSHSSLHYEAVLVVSWVYLESISHNRCQAGQEKLIWITSLMGCSNNAGGQGGWLYLIGGITNK